MVAIRRCRPTVAKGADRAQQAIVAAITRSRVPDGTCRTELTIDLHKFRKDFEECSDLCEKWLYSIRNMHLLKTRPAGIKGTELEELYTEAHYAAWSAEKRRRYEELIMNRHDYDVVLQHSYDMGVEAGVEKGREEGKAEGKADAARKMIASGMLQEQVAEILQLSAKELDALLAL